MLGNDEIGNCAIVGPAHQELSWTVNDQATPYCPTEAEILKAYRAVSGYVPGRPETDVGCDLLSVMRHWRSKGIGKSRIEAFARLSNQLPGGPELVRQAINAFGGVTLGLDMPIAWSWQSENETWNAPRRQATSSYAPGSWGGHCVIAVGYNARELKVVTWGRVQRMTWGALQVYGFECWVPVGPSLWGEDRKSPKGFDAARLLADAAAIR